MDKKSGENRIVLKEQNPMLTNEIIKQVLVFVPMDDLKECRGVCFTWWKESLRRFRSSKWITITTGDEEAGDSFADAEQSGENVDMIPHCIPMREFLSFWDTPGDPFFIRNFPYKKLRLFKCKLGRNLKTTRNGWFSELCDKAGPNVTYLAIDACTIVTTEGFRKIIFRFAPKLECLWLKDNFYLPTRRQGSVLVDLHLETLVRCTNDVQTELKHLKITMEAYGGQSGTNLPLAWTEFFAHFPNLKNLELVKLPKDLTEDEPKVLFQSIQALRSQCGILQNLTGLDLLNMNDLASEWFRTEILTVLENMSLPLTYFAYDMGHEKLVLPGDNHFKKLMNLASETLQVLTIYKGPYCRPWYEFRHETVYPKLTKLTLVGPILGDLYCLEFMPQLKILRLFHDESTYEVDSTIPQPKVLARLRSAYKRVGESEGELKPLRKRYPVVKSTIFSDIPNLTLPNLEELIIDSEKITGLDAKRLANLLPNIKRLRIGLTNTSFRAVCQYWCGLEALDVNPFWVDDEGMTGIVPEKSSKFPNITNLKYLKSFGMGMNIGREGELYELTDFSYENGLRQLQYLEKVSLWCSENKMSNDTFKELHERFPKPDSFIKRATMTD